MKNLLLTLSLLATTAAHAQQDVIVAGTDINPGTGHFSPRGYTECNGKLYYVATTDTAGYELWVTDKLLSNTRQVKNIRPGVASSMIAQITTHNNKIYFTAIDGVHGRELWVSDGTEAGTVMVKDINAGPGNSMQEASPFFIFNGKLMFNAADPTQPGFELFTSDGTAAGTAPLAEVSPFRTQSKAPIFCVYNGKAYFAGITLSGSDCELWVTDGTQAGTMLVKDIEPGFNGLDPVGSTPGNFKVFNGKLYFGALSLASGYELWATDGTSAGTTMVKDINPGTRFGFYPPLVEYSGKLYFQGDDNTHSKELWSSDGSSSGTQLVSDIRPGTDPSLPQNFTVFNSKLYFSANDGTTSNELWVTDGSAAGTKLFLDIYAGSASDPENFIEYRKYLYFTAHNSTGERVFRTDGTAAGTIVTAVVFNTGKPLIPTTLNGGLYLYDSSLYFTADDGATGQELWTLKDTVKPAPPHTNVNTVKNSTGLSVHPNPNSGQFTITVKDAQHSAGTIYVYDVMGREVKQQPVARNTHTVQLNLSGMAPGTYTVQWQTGERVYARQVVVQ